MLKTKSLSVRRCAQTALLMVLSAGSTASAQSLAAAPFVGGNFGNNGANFFYDINVANPAGIALTSLDLNTNVAAGTAITCTLFTCPSTYIGNTTNAAAWTSVATGTMTAAGANLPTHVTFSNPITFLGGSTQGFCIQMGPNAPHAYTTGTALQTYSNADLSLTNVGANQNTPFTSALNSPRLWNGVVYYTVLSGSGACCKTDGTCSTGTALDCANANGVFHSEWANCAAASCPAAGACCRGDGTCANLTQAACASVTNSVFTAGVTCTSPTTVTCTGACCNTDGTCSDNVSKNACLGAAGVFSSGGSTCATTTCAPAGACCKPDGTCANLTQVACRTAAGFWTSGSNCAATPTCNGSCCFGDGTCSDGMTWNACAAAAGVFKGTGSVCSSSGCRPELYFDDGRIDNSIGYNAALSTTWALKLTSEAGKDRMTHVRVVFGTNAGLNGKSATVQLFPDNGPTPGNPTGATGALATSTGTVWGATAGPANNTPYWVDFDISDVTIPAGTTFFAVVTTPNNAAGEFPAGADASNFATGRCWITNGTTGTVPTTMPTCADITLNATPLNYTWMIRVDTVDSTTVSSCYANCDSSTQNPFLNVQDFTCFLGKFSSGATYANCDNSTQAPVLNVQDFTCFLQKFSAGCSAP